MSYETRSIILKVYQNSYRFSENLVELDTLIDSYYLGRRALRKDLEFDDSKSAQSSEKIINTTLYNEIDESDFKWKITNILAYSPRPGYPNKSVSINTLNETIKLWKKNKIVSIICLLSEEEINQYYKEINFDLIGFYKKNGFNVRHIPIKDFQKPPISVEQTEIILQEEATLKKPLLVHCGAGQDRSGHLVQYLTNKYINEKN